jgi:antitoxin component of RelBE/YafQ-DinJ toxin-antitoxin module
MNKTVLSIKTDKKVKEDAQKAARELGLPLGTILNAYLRELAREKRVVFSVPPEPNRKKKELLRKMLRDKKGKGASAGPFTYEEAVDYLGNA